MAIVVSSLVSLALIDLTLQERNLSLTHPVTFEVFSKAYWPNANYLSNYIRRNRGTIRWRMTILQGSQFRDQAGQLTAKIRQNEPA